MIRELKYVACLAAFVTFSPQRAIGQQEDESIRLLLGVSLASLRTNHPEGDGFAAGALIGLDRRIRSGSSLRAYATVSRGVSNADDIAICHPAPSGCLADAAFPKWQFGLGAEGSFSPRPSWPVRLLTGLGVVLSTNPQTKGGSVSSELGSEFAGVWRLGIEVPFGSSPRAPAIQLTRSGFVESQYSVFALDAVTLNVRK